MSWTRQPSGRKARLPSDWQAIRRRILERDGHRCRWIEQGQRCMGPGAEVDHVHPGDDHRDSNLRALCVPHHALKSAREGARARTVKWSTRRPVGKHPGLR